MNNPNQTAISQSRQGFPPLRAFDSLIKLTIADWKIYSENTLFSSIKHPSSTLTFAISSRP